MTPLKAIKAWCLDCSGGERKEVVKCTCNDCPLFPFRLGKNTLAKKREYTPEQKAEMAARLKKARENKDV